MSELSREDSIDWLELERLVDGQLSGDSYRQLIEQIEAKPNGWRQCATAFLEHQALQHELTSLMDDASCEFLSCIDPLANLESQPPAGDLNTVVAVEKPAVTKPFEQKWSRDSMASWLSMGLCIACGLALGLTVQSGFMMDRLGAKSTTAPSGFNQASVASYETSEPDSDSLEFGSFIDDEDSNYFKPEVAETKNAKPKIDSAISASHKFVKTRPYRYSLEKLHATKDVDQKCRCPRTGKNRGPCPAYKNLLK